jgi:hypothetical protein
MVGCPVVFGQLAANVSDAQTVLMDELHFVPWGKNQKKHGNTSPDVL